MRFKATFCDPFIREIIQLGEFDASQIFPEFEKIKWEELLGRMMNYDGEIYYSPSFEFQNTANRHGLAISIVGSPTEYEWYIFYKRPKAEKRFFGLSEKMNENYLTDITGQSIEDVKDCIKALLENDLEFLDQKIR